MAESGVSKKSLRAGLCFKRPTITSIRQWKRSMFGVGIRSFWSWRDFQKFPPKASASATVTGTASSVGLVFARPKGASTKKNTKDAAVPTHYSFDTLIWGEVDANTTTCHTPAVYTLARANIDASPWPNLHFGICVGPCLRAITRRTMNQLNLKIIAWMGRIP